MSKRLWAIAIAALVILAGVGAIRASSFVTAMARANLSSAGFERAYETTPEALGLPAENVTIMEGDVRLAGWWIPPPRGAPAERAPDEPAGPSAPSIALRANTTVILVHGLESNAGHATERWAPSLHGAGFAVLAIDLRNHGASADGPLGYVTYGASEADDVLAAIAHVRGRASELGVDPERIAIFGGSMGAAAVLRAASLHPDGLSAVIADSPYASLGFQARIDGADQGYPRFLADLVVWRMRMLAPADPDLAAPATTIGRIDVPLLLTHCTNDTRIQVASFDALAPLAPAGTQTWREPCPGRADDDHHLSGWKMPAFNATVVSFLDAAR